MSDAAASTNASDDSWWYEKGEETIGPVSAAELRGLSLPPETMVWHETFGEAWKPYAAAGFTRRPPPLGTPDKQRLVPSVAVPEAPRPEQRSAEPSSGPKHPYNSKWQKVFDAAAAEKDAWNTANRTGTQRTFKERLLIRWRLASIPGFLFGPLYYFYLGMWRKGTLVLGLVPLVEILEIFFGKVRALDSAITLLCGVLAKRDYYKYCMEGEDVWPLLRWSKNIWTDICIVVGAVLVFVVVALATDDNSSDASSTKSQTSENTSTEGIATIDKEPDFKTDGSYYNVFLTSHVDSLRIDSFVLNRGSCEGNIINDRYLRFGQKMQVQALCDPIEATVKTNRGTLQFTWSR